MLMIRRVSYLILTINRFYKFRRFLVNYDSWEGTHLRIFFSDMKRKRRVKLVGRSTFRSAGQQQPISSTSTDGGDCPKTLEYKSFLRLVQEAGRGSSSNWKEDKRNTLVQHANAEEPAKQHASLSPTKHLADKKSQPVNGGTFYTKRQNLVKLAASILSLEESEVNSKGHDVIPALLHRIRINKKYKDNDNSEYPHVTYPEDQIFPDKESFAATDLSSCSWKKYDETSPLREQNVVLHFPKRKKYQTMEPMLDHEIVAYSGPLQRDLHVPLLRWDEMDDERVMTLVSECQGNNELYQRPLTLYNHGFSGTYSSSLIDAPNQHPGNQFKFKFSETVEPMFHHEIFTYSDPSLRDFHVPLLRWDGMDNEREIPSTSEGQGNNQVDQWPPTFYDHGFEGAYSNSLSQPEYLRGPQWGEYLSTGFYEDHLSPCHVSSASGRLLLGSADDESGVFVRGQSFHLQEIDGRIEDEGGTSMIKWMTPE